MIHETGTTSDEEAKEMREQVSNEVGPHTAFHCYTPAHRRPGLSVKFFSRQPEEELKISFVTHNVHD